MAWNFAHSLNSLFLMGKKDPIGFFQQMQLSLHPTWSKNVASHISLNSQTPSSRLSVAFVHQLSFFFSLKSILHQVLMDVPKHSFFCITNYQEHGGSLIMSSNWIEAGAKYLRWSGHWLEDLTASFSIRNQHVSRLPELLCTYWLMAIIYYSAEDLALS